MAVTNEEIEKIQESLNEKIVKNRQEQKELRNQYDSLEKIKFKAREVEETPAKYETVPDANDPKKTVKVLAQKAVMKTVYDVPPPSADDPTATISEEVRANIFKRIKSAL